MNVSVQLDLVSGGRAQLVLEEPDQFPSSYFISLEDSGALQLWHIVSKILESSKRSVCWFTTDLWKKGLTRQDVTNAALRNLLQTRGYAFGIFCNIDPALTGLDQTGNQTFVLVRDPRDVVVSKYLAMKGGGGKVPADHLRQALVDDRNSNSRRILDFVQSPDGDHIARRFRQVADFCRSAKNVTVFRYEDVMFSWRTVVADLIQRLDLEISLEAALAIADSTETLSRRSQVNGTGTDLQGWHAMFRECLDKQAISVIEEKFADSMAHFGYVPEETPPPAFLDHHAEFFRAISERLSTVHARCLEWEACPRKPLTTADAPSHTVVPSTNLAEQDPVLLFRLTPNASSEMTVLGRRVMMDVDATGCRPVIGQPQTGEKTLAAYGCSWTYGMAIPAEETFCSLLQLMFPAWRVENHGVFGHGGTQNLIQLERDARWSAPDYVTFCWIPSHMLRNVADPAWVRKLTQDRRRREASTGPIQKTAHGVRQRTFPRASLGGDGTLEFRSVKFPRPDLIGIDLRDFSPDAYYLDLVCFNLFRRAAEIVKGNGGHFFVTTLQDHLSQHLQRLLKDAGIPVVDASVNGEEYTCLPDDVHPNALANRIFAEKIRDYLVQHEPGLI
jgi:hypothetical protein